jgi:hypothetical protein
MLVTANKHRTGYSKEMRVAFINAAEDLKPLRERADWNDLLTDPDGYVRENREPK